MIPPFVTLDDLGHLQRAAEGRRGPVLADVRWSLDGSEGRHTYVEGHLPGAVFVDLDRDLADPPTSRDGRHPLPSAERFAAALGARGIGQDDTVVAYDTAGGVIAARLVWLLRVIGQDAAVLAGGPAAWDGRLEEGEVVPTPVGRDPVPWPAGRFVDADDVAALAAMADAVVLDARAPERFRGDLEPIDPRPGHVPGACNLPTAALLTADGVIDGPQLRARAEALGVTEAGDVAAYCGSGVTACFDLLALETLGVRGRLYPGSWSAWSADPSRPVATGD